MSNLRGPATDTRAGDEVCLLVPPDGPYGVTFVPDVDGCAAVVQSFEPLASGKFGVVQRHGGIHVGDVLFEINDNNLMNRPFLDAMKLVTDRNTLKKEFKFLNNKEYYRRKRTGSLRTLPVDRNPFFSSIRRSRTSSESSGKKFTEYEIACQFRVASNKVQKENVYQWSVWKRYSELEKLHQRLRVSLGWQMDGVAFPPARNFTFNKLSAEFVEQRKQELSSYWQKVLSIDKVTEFHKHHCNLDLKEFLEVEANTKREVAPAADMVSDDSSSVAGSISPVDSEKKPVRRVGKAPSRRISLSKMNSINSVDSSAPVAPLSPASSSSQQTNIASPSSVPESTSQNVPPTPPPRPESMFSAPPPAPASAPSSAKVESVSSPPAPSANLPPKPSGARANLLGAINARRID